MIFLNNETISEIMLSHIMVSQNVFIDIKLFHVNLNKQKITNYKKKVKKKIKWKLWYPWINL